MLLETPAEAPAGQQLAKAHDMYSLALQRPLAELEALAAGCPPLMQPRQKGALSLHRFSALQRRMPGTSVLHYTCSCACHGLVHHQYKNLNFDLQPGGRRRGSRRRPPSSPPTLTRTTMSRMRRTSLRAKRRTPLQRQMMMR